MARITAPPTVNAYFLEEDITRFEIGIFNIQPGEAEALDPQQRFLLETVYDSLYNYHSAISIPTPLLLLFLIHYR